MTVLIRNEHVPLWVGAVWFVTWLITSTLWVYLAKKRLQHFKLFLWRYFVVEVISLIAALGVVLGIVYALADSSHSDQQQRIASGILASMLGVLLGSTLGGALVFTRSVESEER